MTTGPDNRILEAKFRMPALMTAIVGRPRLFARLDEAITCKLLVVTAPAGFGKTTLISSWLRDRRPEMLSGNSHSQAGQYAWLSLDARENNLAVFLAHFVGALRHVSPGIDFETANILQSPAYPPVDDIVRLLIGDLNALPGDMTLVLDDYHVVQEPGVHALLESVVAYSPDRFHLVILTRHDPPLPVARLCLQGKARQLRSSDLRFRPEEAERFFAVALPVEAPRETLAAITAQSGGWIAQLRLAALLLQQSPDQVSPDAVRNLAMDYLMEELLASEEPAVRAFLLATSVLERFCAPLTEALLVPPLSAATTDQGGLLRRYDRKPAQVFRYVVQAGLFVTELDSGKRWYSYHDLFRDLLYQRLQRDYPDDIILLRRSAFQWLRENGYVEEALSQAQALGDGQAVADLVESHVLAAVQSYRWQTAQRWLDMLAPETVLSRPALALAYCYILFNSGAIERIERVLQWVERTLDGIQLSEPSRQERIWLGHFELLRAEYFSFINRLEDSLRAAKRSLELLPVECFSERAFAMLRLQSALAYEGKFEEGRELLRAQLREATDETAPWYVRTRISLALNYSRSGDFRRAKHELERMRHLLSHDQAYNECWSHYILGRIAYEWNDLHSAAEHFRSAASAHGGNYLRACESFLGLALTAEARGDWEEASRAIDQALAMAKALRSEDLVTLTLSCRTRLLLMRGESSPGLVHLPASVREDPLILMMPIELPRLTEVRRLLSEGKPAALKEAQRMMEEAVKFMTEAHLQVWLPHTLALLALVYRARDQRVRARETLTRAIELGAPGGFIRSFLDFGPQLTGMLYELKLPGAAGEHVAAILSAAAQRQRISQSAGNRDARLIEPLTNREIAVLKLVAENLSDKEIAATLCISPLTVRKHTGNIFAKLDVSNRRQAAARAAHLGLVTPPKL